NAHKIEVREVEKGEVPGMMTPTQRARQFELDERVANGESLSDAEAVEYERLNQMVDLDYSAGEPKFGSYTLFGGENYRELLLTLPPSQLKDWAVMNSRGRVVERLPTREQADARAGELGEGFRVEESVTESSRDFRGGHFDEPNVLLHVRFNDRVIDGKHTLFVEELQSDWHQRGRKQGYGQRQRDSLTSEERTELRSLADRQAAGERFTPEEQARQDALTARAFQDLQAQADLTGENPVPDAPFKTTWPELGMKRMIRYAAEKGYDQIAWTTGETQAERYDLSTHLDRIEYQKEGDKWRIRAYSKDEPEAIFPGIKQIYESPNEISEAFGKEIADKIVGEEGRPLSGRLKQGMRSLTGDNLKVGGEGMAGFYDKMLVNIAGKLGKRFGAKVGQGNIVGKTKRQPASIVSANEGYQISFND